MSDVLVTQAGPILEVLFNRPDKKSALSGAIYPAVTEAFRQANADASVRVGAAERGIRLPPATTSRIFKAGRLVRTHASPFLAVLASLTPPLVAAVNGAAIGVGTTMLAHADSVVAARSARFAMPFTSLGLVRSPPVRCCFWGNHWTLRPPSVGAWSIRSLPMRT